MRIRFPLLVSLAAFMITTASFGSGFALFEAGAKAVAMGGAFAATADDPSAIWYNVAGIAQQRRGELLIGGTAITFQNSFTGDPNDLFTAGTHGSLYRAHTFVVPNGYVTVPFGGNSRSASACSRPSVCEPTGNSRGSAASYPPMRTSKQFPSSPHWRGRPPMAGWRLAAALNTAERK